MVVREATTADAAMLAALGARLFGEAFGAANTPENLAAYLAASFSPAKQHAELVDPTATFLVAETDGPIGYAQLHAGRPPAPISGTRPVELVRLYAGRVGEGVGSVLMRACLDRAAARGHDVLWLGVWEHNSRAQEFYRRWGFETVGTHGFQLGRDLQTDLLMERRVDLRRSKVGLKPYGDTARHAERRS